ncbi:MAG: uncharacterized protein A8A55_3224 [Amphiamblys sp. WSBS2006]|nr:MAG: uncharacterized protein A8A55_3224 [Amphiamblys sp. WSBS2006]
MRNTGIFFLELLGETVFIPVIEIEVDRCMEHLGVLGKTTGIHVGTNALVENITDLKTKQKIGEVVIQKETAVKNEFGYRKLVFKKDSKHEEQSETGESEEQPIAEYKDQEGCFKERSQRDLHRYDFSDYLYGDYED